MVEWRPAQRADIETAIREGMVEPIGISAEGVRHMAYVGLNNSFECRAYFINGKLAMVGGIMADHALADDCHIWLTCLPEVLKHPTAFLRLTRKFLATLPFARVSVLCDPGFAATVKWIRWLGFTPAGTFTILDKEYDVYERAV